MSTADAEFGSGEVLVRTLTDSAGLMRKAERVVVQEAIERFSKRFPQLFFAVYTCVLRETTNLREFGFWLLNRGVFEDFARHRLNAAGILLVMDVEGKAAGITYGYLLDPYLDEDDTFQCLSKAHPYWLDRRPDQGIVALLKTLEKILKKKSRATRKGLENFERKVTQPPQMGDLVKIIRSVHVHNAAHKQDAATSTAREEECK